MRIISFISRQVWPQVIAFYHLRPSRCLLLHSSDEVESKRPAENIKKRICKNALGMAPGDIAMAEMDPDSYSAIQKTLDALVPVKEAGCELEDEWVVNLTGGTKLMTMAGFDWAMRRGIRAFYLDRGFRINWFNKEKNEVITDLELVNGHNTDHLDAMDLLQCQLDASLVKERGEKIQLSPIGKSLNKVSFNDLHTHEFHELEKYITIDDRRQDDHKEGDFLEILTAIALLVVGIPEVYRSVTLKVRPSPGITTNQEHAEIDLIFNWHGRLWIVDVKDRKAEEEKLNHFDRLLKHPLYEDDKNWAATFRRELQKRTTKVLKEDLIAVREIGGLLGKVICVRKSRPSQEERGYARNNNIEIVKKDSLVSDLEQILTKVGH